MFHFREGESPTLLSRLLLRRFILTLEGGFTFSLDICFGVRLPDLESSNLRCDEPLLCGLSGFKRAEIIIKQQFTLMIRMNLPIHLGMIGL